MCTTAATTRNWLAVTEPAYPKRAFPCPWCNTSVDSMQNWQGHANRLHPHQEETEAYRHMADVIRAGMRKAPIVCPVFACSRTFLRYSSMLHHYKTIHPEQKRTWRRNEPRRCLSCARILLSHAEAILHAQTHVKSIDCTPQGGEIEDEDDVISADVLSYQGGEEEEEEEEEEAKEADSSDVVDVSPHHCRPTLKRAAPWAADDANVLSKRARSDGLKICVPFTSRPATISPEHTTSAGPRMYRITSLRDPSIAVHHLDGMPLPDLGPGPLILERIAYFSPNDNKKTNTA